MATTLFKLFFKHAIFGLLLMGFFAFRVHDFHTSITEMQLSPTSKKIEISMRLFTDDLETALSKHSGKKIVLEKGNHDVLLKQYIEKHFRIKDKAKTVSLSFEGQEAEGNATWLYVEMPSPSTNFADLSIQNDVLMDIFDDQINILNTFEGKIKKSYLFSFKKTLHELN